jgi:hypothetical protein
MRCSLQHVYQTNTYEHAGGPKLPATLVILTTDVGGPKLPATLVILTTHAGGPKLPATLVILTTHVGGPKLPATLVILTTHAADQGRAPASLCFTSSLYPNSFFFRLSKAECLVKPSGMSNSNTVWRSRHWPVSSEAVRRASTQQLHTRWRSG